MRNIKILIGVSFILLFSCNNSLNYKVAYTINEKDLIPEGITFSKQTNSFYLSSIYKKKIIQINAETGEFNDFVASQSLGLSMLGLYVDNARNQLWACGNITKDNQRISSIIKFDLKSNKIIKNYEHIDTVFNTFNDLVLDKDGNAYFTNESSQTIYKIDHKIDSIEVFYSGSEVEYPNGITISPNNKYLYVASGSKGIRIIDISERKIVNAENEDSRGIDGLKYYKNSIIGIMNYVSDPSERNISRYYLNREGNQIESIKVIDINNPYYDIPTTFDIVNGKIFCLANSQLLNIKKGEIVDPDALKDIIILKYEL